MKKRFLSILLTICMLLTLLPTVVSAAEVGNNFQVGDLFYEVLTKAGIENGTVEVTDPSVGSSYDQSSYEIPATVTYEDLTYDVVGIGITAFASCAALTSVTLPESITYIGEYAFEGCKYLASINIPEGVSRIGQSAFYYCVSLTALTVPASVTTIENIAFSGCENLDLILLYGAPKTIADNAFAALADVPATKSVTHRFAPPVLKYEGAALGGLVAERLTWNSPGGANGYTVRFYDSAEGTTPRYTAIEVNVGDTNSNLPVADFLESKGAPSGTYYAAVTARGSGIEESEESDRVAFAYTAPEAAPAVTTDALPDASIGESYSYALEAGGDEVTWSVSGGSLPDGLTLDETTGVISGVPTTEGSSAFTVTAANDVGSDSVEFTLRVRQLYWVGVYTTADRGDTTSDAGGSVTGAGCYGAGDAVTMTVTFNKGYCAAGWSAADSNLEGYKLLYLDGIPDYASTEKTVTFTMPEQDVYITASFRAHDYAYSYRDNEDGTHTNVCRYCEIENGAAQDHVDDNGGGDGTTPPDGYCDLCSAKMIYTISFDANTGSGSMADVEYTFSSSGYTLPANGFTAPENKAFVGWAASADGPVINGSTYPIMENTTLYAIWEDHTHSYSSVWLCDASYHWRECACGGKFETAEHSGPAATATTPQTCTVCGYEIAPAKTTYSLTVNYEIYANDGAIVGSGIENRTVELAPGTKVDMTDYWPEQMTSVGNDDTTYYFSMFSYNADGSGKVYNEITITEDTVMYASWVTNPMITVTFDTNGGTMPYAAARAKMNVVVDLMNSQHRPVRAGYEFAGWSLADDSTADDGEVEIKQDCTLYAVWQETTPTGYTLTFHYGVLTGELIIAGGSKKVGNIAPGTVVDLSEHWPDSLRTVSDDTVSVFYNFAGFTKKGQSDIMNSVTVNSDMELQAEWVTQEMITVTFDTNDGIMPYEKRRVSREQTLAVINSNNQPTRSAYEFVGWSLADDGTADPGDTLITTDCTLYAVWQQYLPSYDDDYYDPPPASIPVSVGGDYDAILRDGMVIVRGDDPISGTLDLGKTDAEAIRLPADAVKASTGEGNSLTIRFPGGTSALITAPGLAAAEDALRSGESLQIAVRPVDAGALPENLTAPPAVEDDEVLFDSGALTGAVIFTEQELLDLGVISNDDKDITWEELKYLYHYMTTEKLKSLELFIEHFYAKDINSEVQVWLAEMIERDGVVVNLDTRQLDESGIRSKLEEVGYTGGGFTLGLLRQADLNMEQLEYIIVAMQEIIGVRGSGEVLAWANEAIAQKELEQENATVTSMTLNGLEEYADLTDKQMQILRDMGLQNLDNPSVGQIKKLDLTLEQMELLYAEIDRARSTEYNPEYQAEYGVLLNWLEEAISEKEQENKDAPTYINIGGERFAFVSALEADVKAVKGSGRARNLEILADRSNAVAWSTTIPSSALYAGLGNLRAYKVLEDGGLEAKAAKVTLNADGTLTASALSNGNSTYIFVLEPNPYTDVDESDWYYDAAMTMDQRLLMQGTTTTTFGGGASLTRGMIWTILARLDGMDTDRGVIWYSIGREWAVTNGVSDGTDPETPITREQLAAMLYRYAIFKGHDISVGEDTNILSWPDVFEVSEYAIPAMQWACGEGIIGDKGGGLLDPRGKATRAEAAVMLARFCRAVE